MKLVGSDDQDVVLVTGCQTFKLTKAETSNTLLLVPPPSEKVDDGHGDSDSGNPGGTGARPAVGTGTDGSGTFEALALTSFQYEVKNTCWPSSSRRIQVVAIMPRYIMMSSTHLIGAPPITPTRHVVSETLLLFCLVPSLHYAVAAPCGGMPWGAYLRACA